MISRILGGAWFLVVAFVVCDRLRAGHAIDSSGTPVGIALQVIFVVSGVASLLHMLGVVHRR